MRQGRFRGGVLKALDAGFKNIATVEISEGNQEIGKNRVSEHPMFHKSSVKFVLGDAEEKIEDLLLFAKDIGVTHPVFWLDAHTHVFEEGIPTNGNPCPLVTEISKINQAFQGEAILLVDDLRIIGANGRPLLGIRRRLVASIKAFIDPPGLFQMLKPGWGSSVDLLSIMRLATHVPGVSFCLLDGIEPREILCVYPSNMHSQLFTA